MLEKQKTLCVTLVTSDVTHSRHSRHSTHSTGDENCPDTVDLPLLAWYELDTLYKVVHDEKWYKRCMTIALWLWYDMKCYMVGSGCMVQTGTWIKVVHRTNWLWLKVVDDTNITCIRKFLTAVGTGLSSFINLSWYFSPSIQVTMIDKIRIIYGLSLNELNVNSIILDEWAFDSFTFSKLEM